MFAWYSFTLFKLDVICHNDSGKERFHLADRKKSPMAVEKYHSVRIEDEEVTEVAMTYHACRPSPKARWSGDVLTATLLALVTLPSLS